MYPVKKYRFLIIVSSVLFLAGCKAEGDYPGREFSPNMYHSIAYEPYRQITDIDAGKWVSNDIDGRGEFFNSNPFNPYGLNLRQPPANTVKRGGGGIASLPYRIHRDSLALAARTLTNPLEPSEEVLNQGRALYTSYCFPCHGGAGQGNGPVGQVYLGVASFTSDNVRNAPAGHIFHVITHGRGRMYPHGSQISPEDRWKIVHYVSTLQQGGK